MTAPSQFEHFDRIPPQEKVERDDSFDGIRQEAFGQRNDTSQMTREQEKLDNVIKFGPGFSGGVEYYVKRNFEKWDADKDGFLSPSDIERAQQNLDPKQNGFDGEVLFMLKRSGAEIAKLSNDEYGFENNGVSLKDVEKLQALLDRRGGGNNDFEDRLRFDVRMDLHDAAFEKYKQR